MATATETLRATLSLSEYGALKVLAESGTPLSGRKVATALGASPTTANDALSTLSEAGFATSRKVGQSHPVAARGFESFDQRVAGGGDAR
jgi:hypothetical protein